MFDVSAQPPLDSTIGTLFIGVLVGAALWGISCMQVYEYATECRKDYRLSKMTVWVVFTLDTVHQMFVTHATYVYVIKERFNNEYLNVVVWSLVAQVLSSALVGIMVQSFFVYRIWILSHRNVLVVFCVMLLVLAGFAMSLVYFVNAFKVTTFSLLPTLFAIGKSVNALAAGGDIAIATTLIFLLHRSRTGFSNSDSVLNQLILFSLGTGFVTSVCSLMSLLAVTVFPTTFIFIPFYITLTRVYTNSLLATLNARKKLRSHAGIDSYGSTRNYSGDRTESFLPMVFNHETLQRLASTVATKSVQDYRHTLPKCYGYDQPMLGGGYPIRDMDHNSMV